ncbi:urease subunit gamma [Natronococcus sp. A-GB1]|uniref:Urease subunit gamma n=1 Tax=Natronococcus amylolyticus DSM 10524 TaxID=1227497 RepID=L9X8N5_9EURY|nr:MULTISPECIES: urease subunit gamma [Natronococcus]ELY58075.1 urease subunit gamma [Natronococcus amylolyticus DSM 10524]MDG5759594.1 urease subunit gamma [Natronococcus sp. A-GB1]
MMLSPKEMERLTVFMAAELARRRKDRGVKLNHPETVAYVSDWCCEAAREGKSVSRIRSEATQLLTRDDVMDGVPELVGMIQVEPVFPDGTKLVTVHDPIRADTREQLETVDPDPGAALDLEGVDEHTGDPETDQTGGGPEPTEGDD